MKRWWWYYAAVLAIGLGSHTPSFETVAGDAVTSLLRRNSEAFVLMLAVPAFVERVMPAGRRARWGYVTAMAVIAGLLQSQVGGSSLPGAIVTLVEGFWGAAVIAGYLWWVEARRPSASRRAWYYGAAIVGAVVGHVGSGPVLDFLDTNIEALVAMVVIPFGIEWATTRLRLLGWSVFMVVIPVLAQPGVGGATAASPVADLLVRATEAFLASLVVAWYLSPASAPAAAPNVAHPE